MQNISQHKACDVFAIKGALDVLQHYLIILGLIHVLSANKFGDLDPMQIIHPFLPHQVPLARGDSHMNSDCRQRAQLS